LQPARITHFRLYLFSEAPLTASKDAKELFPLFKPLNMHIEIWLAKVEEFALIYNWNKETRAKVTQADFMLTKLAGMAAT